LYLFKQHPVVDVIVDHAHLFNFLFHDVLVVNIPRFFVERQSLCVSVKEKQLWIICE
jgi:hypothetical protein